LFAPDSIEADSGYSLFLAAIALAWAREERITGAAMSWLRDGILNIGGRVL
jgi:hypothetical protein